MSSSRQNFMASTRGEHRRSTAPELRDLDAYRSSLALPAETHFVWCDYPMPLASILKDNELPVIVKIPDEAKVVTEEDSAMDFRQPLLLYRQHQESRLYARNVMSAATSTEKEVGPYVVIPSSYQGLFRPAGQPGSPIASVSTVAGLMPVSMLSCSPCKGYRHVQPIQPDVIYQKASLPPGVYVIKDTVEDVSTSNGAQKSKKSKPVKCLRCLNEENQVVLFPMKSIGQFYLADVGSCSARHLKNILPSSRVYRWTELIHLSGQEPRYCDMVAILLHGNPPPQECGFTGILAFKHVATDTTVIGCTTSEESPRLFELSPTNGPNFVIALNQDCFNDLPIARRLQFARLEFDRYVSGIKVRKDYEVDLAKLRESVS